MLAAMTLASTSNWKNLRHAFAAADTFPLTFRLLISVRSLNIVHLSAAEDILYRFENATYERISKLILLCKLYTFREYYRISKQLPR